MTSSISLVPIADVNIDNNFDIPDLHPLHYTIGLSKLDISSSKLLYRKLIILKKLDYNLKL